MDVLHGHCLLFHDPLAPGSEGANHKNRKSCDALLFVQYLCIFYCTLILLLCISAVSVITSSVCNVDVQAIGQQLSVNDIDNFPNRPKMIYLCNIFVYM